MARLQLNSASISRNNKQKTKLKNLGVLQPYWLVEYVDEWLRLGPAQSNGSESIFRLTGQTAAAGGKHFDRNEADIREAFGATPCSR